MPKWDEITKNEKYQNLPPEARAQLKTEWFKANLLPEIESKPSLKEMGVEKVYEWFMQQPDDTGQGYVTSMLGAAGRGFGEMVPGAIEGVGALTGSEGLREFGQDVRGGLESISPVNPIYGESIPVKLAGVGGQVGSMLATAGAGGAVGKALGGVGAVSKGAQTAALGSAFLQGSAEGARQAEEYGMTGPEAYLRTLAGGAIEAGTEFLPFGMTAETALAKRILTGAPRTGTFLGAVGSEAGEEGLGQIASNIATKTLAPAGVETPDITAGALEAAAYGAAGGAMLGGVNALISTPPERQTQIQKDLQAEAGAIPKDTVPDQTNEEKMAAMEKGGVTVVSPEGKTAVITPEPEPEPSMPNPAEVAKTIGESSVEQLAATGNEASAAAQADFNAILAETLGETPEPTIQPKQAAEEAGAEVTPLSEGAERNRAVIAEAAAKLRGEAPKTISAGVKAAIPQQPAENQEDATIQREIPENRVEERVQTDEGWPTAETGGGNRVVEGGEVQEEVVVSSLPSGRHRFSKTKLSKLPKQVVDALMQRKTSLDNSFNFTSSPSIDIDEDSYYTLVNPATGESRRLTTPGEFAGTATGKNVVKPTANIPLPKGAFVVYQKKAPGGGMSLGVVEGSFESPKPVITPPGEPTPATEGMVTPGGVATERDLTKVEQMTPEEFIPIGNPVNQGIFKTKKEASARLSELEETISNSQPMKAILAEFGLIPQDAYQVARDSNGRWSIGATHKHRVALAARENLPVSAAAVDTYGITLPEGYVKQGDLYVFQPTAAEKPTPDSVAVEPGATRGVQAEPVGGSIPTVGEVSPETESESSGNLSTAEAAMSYLMDDLTDAQKSKWTPEMFAAAKAYFDGGGKDFESLQKVVKFPRVVSQAYLKADKAASEEQARIDKAQRATDAEIAKAEREEKKIEAEMLKREEMRSKAIDSIIGAAEKKKRKFGQVTNSDAIAAVAMLVSSKDVPGVLTTWTGTKEEFLRDPANQTADPEIYARIKAGELVEGFFNKGRAYVFLDGIGVSDEDMLRGEQMSVTPQVAAVRRVLLHESLVHRGIHGLPLRHRRLILNWVRQNSTPAELDDLAKLYTEYANWRNSDYEFEALAEELLAKKVDSLTEIPKDGPMAKLMDILRQIWDFIVGYKREPTLSDLKSVVKLLKSGAEALANDRLKDGGEVKLSYAGEKAIENLPEERRQFMRDSLETAKAMAAAGKSSEEIRSVTGWFPGKYDGKMRWEVPDEGASMRLDAYRKERNGGSTPEEIVRSFFAKRQADEQRNALALVRGMPKDELLKFSRAFTERQKQENANLYAFFVRGDNKDRGRVPMGFLLDHPTLFESYPDLWWTPVSFNAEDVGFESAGQANADGSIGLNPVVSFEDENQTLSTLLHEIQHIIQNKEGFAKGSSVERAAGRQGWDYYDEGQAIRDYQRTAGEIEARDVQARQKLTPEQRAATAPYSSENIAPEDAIVLFGSGSQASVQFSSETSAAFTAGSEAARSTLYSERDMDIREAIRRAYEAMPKQNSVAVPIGELFAKTEELMPGVTQDEFSLVLQDLFEDNGAVLQEGDSEFIVTTPEGKRAGFVVVMPRAAKASRIKAEGPAVSKLQEDVRNIDEGSVKADFEGVQFTDTKPNQRTVKPKQSYTDAAVEFVDSLQNEGNSLEDIAYSIQSPEFIEGLGIERDLSMQDAIGLEVRNRINNALRKAKAPSVKARLNKLNLSLSKFWQGIGSVKGQHLAIRQKLIADPRYRWMFIKDKAEEAMKEARENVATANITSTDDLTNQMNREGEKASEQAGQSVADDAASMVEEDEDATLIREGEETLDEKSKSLWERAKMLIMRLAMYARADKADIKTGSKASLSKEQRDELNAILRMPKAERDKARAKDEAELKAVLKALLGEEVDAKTPEQKKIRGKRIKGIQTLEKRVKKGKPVDVEIEGETESSEEQVSKAEKTAQSILKGLSERYSDPLIFNEKKPNVDAMRELYKERVKQGVGPNQMTEKSFVNKAVELGVGEKTAGILWKAAELEIDAREAMRQDKILQRKAAVGARADAQAHRIIFAKERLKRQSGFSGIESNANKDTIIKAFQEQVKTPISQDAFIARLRPLNVSETVAKRLFTAAEREKADLEAMEAFRMLEGPDALKNILREIERMRRGEEIPLRTPIPWRQLLSQKAKTVEEYRQRIFDAISANEAFQKLPDDKKAKLADLFSEAWESKRKDILERMLTNLINKEEAAKRISQKGAQALREQSQRLVEDINLGILDSDELMKRLAEKFGIKSEFTEEEKQKIDSLIDTLQDSTLNRVKRNKAAYDLLKTLSGTVKVPITKLLADLWVTNVLSGINTMTSIALAVSSGAFELTSGVLRIIKAAIANQKQLPSEISASFKSLARFLGAFPREANLAWQYLVTGDRAFLDPSMNDVLNDLNYDSIGKSVSLAERLAESDKLLEKTVGVWMRTVSRLLTALDSFNSGVTKSGAIPIVARQLELDPATLAKAEESMNLQNYKDRIIRRDFAGVAPKTAREKALVDSWAKDEMMADLDKYGEFTENADFFGQQGAMTLEPSGIGGMIYRLIKSVTGNLSAGSDRFLAESQRKWQERGKSDSMDATRLALAYALQFIAYNSANLAGLRFARFAGNKFNQGLSFIPGIGMLRLFEADLDKTHVKGKDAFMDMIQRNQFAGVMMSMVGLAILKAIADEPDDEKRGWAFNGGWANLTPERKQQKLAAGEKEYTIRVGDKVFNYQNWPISSVLAAIGGLSDLIRFSPEQWNEKSIAGRLGSAAASGVFAASEIPALSQFQELFGSNLSSKDPNEKKLDRFSRVMAGWGGGFVPRILKDFDFLAEPTIKKYDTLWERTASHIPVYRRYVGDDYYDILGKPIERKIYPGSREFMEKPSAPEYQILGKLNSRGIWLTPANAEHRMVGKGRNRRRLTQEEADAYSLETGKGYRQMLLRYGQRALQMPTERARAFLSDKADEVRDRALKKVYRR